MKAPNVSTLHLNREFSRVYSRGKHIGTPLFSLYYVKGRAEHTRYGITASKKVGNAPARNRARRIIRVAFLSHLVNLKKGYEFVIVAREPVTKVSMWDVYDTLARMFTRNDLYEEGTALSDKTV